MYCDDVKLEADTVLATLYVAKKYIVPHLARACVTFLETSLNAKNACLLLSQSRLFEEPDLMQRCWEVIDAQVSPTIKSLTTTASTTNNRGRSNAKRLPSSFSETQCIYRALSWCSEEDSLSERLQLQRWQGQRIDDEAAAANYYSDELRCSGKLLFASYPLSLSESNYFLFDVKLNSSGSPRQFAGGGGLSRRTRSEPYFLDGNKLDCEVIQNITYKDSFTEEEDYRKDSENNFDNYEEVNRKTRRCVNSNED